MAKKITGQDLFDVSSFDQATQQIVGLIKSITEEIGKAKQASGQLSETLGKSLKAEIEKITSSSKSLEKELSEVKAKFDNLKSTVSNTNDVIKKYEQENKKLETELKKVQEELKKVGTEQTKTNKTQKEGSISAAGLSQSLIGVASGAALVYKGISLLREQLTLAVKSTMEFETAMKEVQAISRASAEQLQLLTSNANRLGATTEKTATQIATLQKELGKLGFNTTEILASTDAIVDLSTATGEDLAGSATVAAATLRAFGLEAIEMSRVVDVMAGSFVRSGLDLEKFRESMKLVAPIARAANIDLETTTAALSKLADAGLSGSLAGTALRNLFSNMADPTSKLATRIGFAVKNSDDLVEAFRKLKSEGVDLAEVVQLVDVRARPAFFTIMNQIDAVEGLATEYSILNGEANDIAETMRDTLANDVDIANSAFDAMRRNIVEQFVPAMRSATQGVTTLSEFIRFLVKDLSEFSTTLKSTTDKGTEHISMLSGLINIFNTYGETIRTYVESSKGVEHFEDLKTSIGSAGDAMRLINQDVAALQAVDTIIEEARKNASLKNKEDKITFSQIIDLVNNLGSEYADIALHIEQGGDLEKAALATKVRVLKNLEDTNNIYLQQVNNLETINRQIAILESKKDRSVEQEKELHTLRADAGFIGKFILENEKAIGRLQLLLNKYKTEGVKIDEDTNKQKEITKKKLSDIILLELERQKIISQGREQELAAQLKEVDEGILTTFKKKELLKDLTQERIRLAELGLEKELRNIELAEDGTRQTLIRQQAAYEKYFNEISKIRRDSFKEVKDINNAEEKHFHDMIKANIQATKDGQKTWKEVMQEREESTEETISKIADMVAQSMQYVSRLTTEIFNNQQIARENELRAIDNWEQRRIELAGDNAEAIEAIEKEAEKKRNEVRKRQAKADRREALFQIAIQTAQGIARAVAQSPLTGGLPFSAIVAALGAAQAAVVASRPLPEFYKGTDDSPEGLAVVGDRYGRELIQDGKTGEYRLTPNKATVQYLSEGSKVFTNKETERILSSVDHNGIAVGKLSGATQERKQPPIDYNKLGKTFEDAVTKIPVSTTNFDQNGVRTFVTKGRNRTERLNNRYKY